MLTIPALRWGQPYASMELDQLSHFATGAPIAQISRANGGLVQRDLRKAQQARDVLRAIPIDELIARVAAAGDLYLHATLPMGDGTQTPDEFVRAQSATTGLPERLARANMKKNGFVLTEMRKILSALTRDLHFDVLTTGHGEERGVPISYQAQSPALGLVLPSNSPGSTRSGCRSFRCNSGWCSSPARRSRGRHRIAEAFFAAGIRARRSPSIQDSTTSVRPCSRAAGAACCSAARPRSTSIAAIRACRCTAPDFRRS